MQNLGWLRRPGRWTTLAFGGLGNPAGRHFRALGRDLRRRRGHAGAVVPGAVAAVGGHGASGVAAVAVATVGRRGERHSPGRRRRHGRRRRRTRHGRRAQLADAGHAALQAGAGQIVQGEVLAHGYRVSATVVAVQVGTVSRRGLDGQPIG